MPRIRSIKPEFWNDSKLALECSMQARLLFIGLWNFADDKGRCKAHPAIVRGSVFPFDDHSSNEIKNWLDELERGDFIRRYEAAGEKYLDIRTFKLHQKIDKPQKSGYCPEPPKDLWSRANPFVEQSSNVRRTVVDSSAMESETESDLGIGVRDGVGVGAVGVAGAPLAPVSVGPPPALPQQLEAAGLAVPSPQPVPANQPPAELDDYPEDDENGWIVPWTGGVVRAPSNQGKRPNGLAMLLHWMRWRLDARIDDSPPDIAWGKALGLLKRHVDRHGVELIRKAWLCWLMDAWAAGLSPPYQLEAFLTVQQVTKQVGRAKGWQWQPSKLAPDDWELPWLIDEVRQENA